MSETRRTAEEVLTAFASEQGLPLEAGAREGEFVLTLPGEKKLHTVCSVVLGERELSLSAFVVRHPDENHAAFFRYLLRHNLRTPGLAYATDDSDDVFVVGRLPFEACTPDALDRLLGVVLEAVDASFNELLLLGFVTSMRREWAWRVARGSRCATWKPSGTCWPGPRTIRRTPSPPRHQRRGPRPRRATRTWSPR